MSDRKQKGRLNLFDLSLIIATLLVFVLGGIGWMEYYPYDEETKISLSEPFGKWSYVFFNTLRAFVFGDDYGGVHHLTTNWKILAAGWLGTYVAAGALGHAGIRLFFGPIARLKASARGGHTAVLGDSPFAGQVAEALAKSGRKVTHHTGLVEIEHDGVLTVPRRHSLTDPFMRSSLNRANRIIVAESDQSATAETALMLSGTNPDTHVFAVFGDRWLAARIRTTRNDEKDAQATRDLLVSVSESAAAAQSVLAKHPPFLFAQRASHKRIHALLIGFGNLGDAIVTDMLNSSLVSFLETPMFTAIDPCARERENSFLGHHPGLDQHIDFEFIEADITAMPGNCLKTLKKRCSDHPVTVAYVAVGAKHTPLAIALALSELAGREGLFEAPIFVRAREGAGLAPVKGGALLGPRQLVAFGSWEETFMASGILDDQPDTAARAYHEEYEKFGTGKPAEISWGLLPERFRVSNRRAVAHIPAKLASLGFDLTEYLSGAQSAEAPLSPNAQPRLEKGREVYASEDQIMMIATLEHDRWMMDRYLDGWRHDEVRDDDARKHDNLIPFDELDSVVQSYDIQLARWLGEYLKSS